MWVAAGVPVSILGAFMMFPFFGITLSTMTVMALGLGLYTVLHPEVRKNRALHATNHESELENSQTTR